ncbi:MAG: Hsp20/alpha crystallin family protein [Anaerolineae bacterium]|jgi:HSP20 family protein|nr:Hsp20/alpha crystallin family protein [Anaerolineae bacterium]
MADEKFDPVKEFTNIRDTLSRAVEQGVKGITANMYPLIDVYETADSVVIRTSPIDGANPETLEVSIENGVLTISGQAVADTDLPEGAVYLSRERKFGTFTRSVRVPTNIQADAAQAKFNKRGALTITLPKLVDSRPQIINITPAE